jgi:hypothetical protein
MTQEVRFKVEANRIDGWQTNQTNRQDYSISNFTDTRNNSLLNRFEQLNRITKRYIDLINDKPFTNSLIFYLLHLSAYYTMSSPPSSVLANLVGERKAANASPSHSSNEKATVSGSTPDPQPSGGVGVSDTALKSNGGGC